MSNYSIQDLAHLSGIKPHTIRIWEQRYKIIKPKRTNTNIRTYNDFELKKLLNISLLLNNGYKISKVAILNEAQLVSEIDNLQLLKIESVSNESSITNLITAMVDFDEEKFEKIFTTSLLKIGFEKTIIQVIFPFLQRVGLLWGINKINPLQEHFISNLIRNKIISFAENQIFSITKKNTFILFLPGNEYHELSILLASYIIKGCGFKVIYLGQNVPVKHIAEILVKLGTCNLLTHITFPLKQAIVSDLKSLVNKKLHSKFYLSGNEISCSNIAKLSTVSFFLTVEDFKKDIQNLK